MVGRSDGRSVVGSINQSVVGPAIRSVGRMVGQSLGRSLIGRPSEWIVGRSVSSWVGPMVGCYAVLVNE